MPTKERNEKAVRRPHHRRSVGGQGRADLLVTCGVVAVLAGVVAGYAWNRPTSSSDVLRYVQSGRLSYRARVPATSVYGATGLTTGEPVYTKLVTNLQLDFAYQFEASTPSTLSGREKLVATIDNGQGIKRSFVVQRSRQFQGDHFDAAGTLSLSSLKAAADAFARAAGSLYGGVGYTVMIAPVVELQGRVGPAALDTTFAPQFAFSYTGSALVPSGSSGTTAAGGVTPAGEGGATPFTATSPGSLTLPNARPAYLLLSGLQVSDARIGALAALMAALLGALVAGRRLLREATSDDEAARVAIRYGSTLVEVDSLPDNPSVVAVDVASFASLMQVARRLECPVLHKGGPVHTYAVVDSGTLYRYRTGRHDISLPSTNGNGSAHLELALSTKRPG